MLTGTCEYLTIYQCYAIWGTTVTLAVTYLGYTLYIFATSEFRRNALEMELLTNQVKRSQQELEIAAETLRHDKEMHQFALWRERQFLQRRSWINVWKPKFDNYITLTSDVPELQVLVEEARTLVTKAVKAGEAFAESYTAESVTLSQLLEGIDGVLSMDDLDILQKKAEKSVIALQNKLIDTIKINNAIQNDFKFDFDQIGVARRSVDDPPHLLKEFNENCDKQHCHRMWLSVEAPTQRGKKRHVGNTDLIHNIYSTPTDYEFTSRNTIQRRDTQFRLTSDLECEESEIVDVGGTQEFFRIAAKPGGDWDSLYAIDMMNNTQTAEMKKQLMAGNVSDFGYGEWMCIRTDTANGGDSAMVAVAIFTTDLAKLNEDVADKLEKC
ncbi:hypothetical protein N7495_009900 [Penicillium taxi]|uniref:uncharacterized protein n=1 Tax=Penicillium taxi TaxID=168475 RepID=UPI00254568BB|nr:uncharacterized protein N7495_009900 [Penicillium taxi]KAJ5885390.1 hypothetical protein N7495_009900 [Penicillium taxi]